ncbi:hypothetical protein HHK36_005819 [Tetracentron sinense]|uniref:Nudix hydrolase domain-containing protein n=1 Tax=Tetracentron sinense TaxID=13715 RepID=A0A834ZQ13_TETSI|nr:hypothetical protein HHK36_005819 [Tetracentron sinense]
MVVQEKIGQFQGLDFWKFPTGIANEGEDICMAAIREVKEETGIDTEFVEVLAFRSEALSFVNLFVCLTYRHSHKKLFEKSELFFLCMLRPLSFDIQKQELEIEAVQWMQYDEYVAQTFVQKDELLNYVMKICLAKENKDYAGFSPVSITSSFSNEKSHLYFNSRDLNKLLSSGTQP